MSIPTDHADRRLRFYVPPDQAGRTLIAFLCARFPFFPEASWVERIEGRRLVVNGEGIAPGRELVTGDFIEYLGWDVPEPAVNTAFSIVYADRHLMAINKPAGLPCHPGGRYLHNSLTMLMKRHLELETLVLVNRLDRETSGLVVVATDRHAGKLLQQQFARRQVRKVYLAYVEGAFPDARRVTGYMAPDPESVVNKRRRFVPADGDAPPAGAPPDAEWAVTALQCLRTNGEISEVEVLPETGRTHQIRAVLLALGYPLVGDKLYGSDPALFLKFCNNTLTDEDRRGLRLDRQALHASALRLRHPSSRQTLDLFAPLPADLVALASALPAREGGRP